MYKLVYRTCTVGLIFFFKEYIVKWKARHASTSLLYHSFKKTKKSCKKPFQKYTLIIYLACENPSLNFKRLKTLHKVDSIQIAIERLLFNIQCNILKARRL